MNYDDPISNMKESELPPSLVNPLSYNLKDVSGNILDKLFPLNSSSQSNPPLDWNDPVDRSKILAVTRDVGEPGVNRTYAPTSDSPGMSVSTLTNPMTGNAYTKALTGLGSTMPVGQTLAMKVQQNGAYEDLPSYMADARVEAYKTAKALGIDITSPEGSQWVKRTMDDALGAANHYIKPSMTKDQMSKYEVTDYGILNRSNGELKPLPAFSMPQSSEDGAVDPKAQMDAAIERAHVDPAFARTSMGKAALIEDSKRHKSLMEQDTSRKDTESIETKARSEVSANKSYQRYKNIADNFNALDALVINKGKGVTGSDAAIVEQFQQIFNPNAAVREFSYANTLAGRSLLNRAQSFIQQMKTGQVLTPKDVQNMRDLAKQAYDIEADSVRHSLTPLAKSLQARGANMDNVFPPEIKDLFSSKKVLTPEIGMQYIDKYGSKKLAMEMAAKDGWKE